MEAKNEFRALLKETKAITYKSSEMMKESNKHYKDIIDVLEVSLLCHSAVIIADELLPSSFHFSLSPFHLPCPSLERSAIPCLGVYSR